MATKAQYALTTIVVATLAMAAYSQTSSCNPELPRYAEWSAGRSFPYALSEERQQLLASHIARLELGQTREEVKDVVGTPDFVADGSLQPNSVACVWFYAFADKGPAAREYDRYMVALGFTADGMLAGIDPGKVRAVQLREVRDKSCETDAATSGVWFDHALGAGKPYVADAERTRKITRGYSGLLLGMSVERIEALLGKPDYAMLMPKGHLGNVWVIPEKCKQQLVYILRQTTNNPVDPDTAAVYLTLNEMGELYWAVPQNVGALKPLGSPVK